MTPNEHEILRLHMRILAQKVLVDWLADTARKQYGSLSSSALALMRSQSDQLMAKCRADYSTITLDWLDPAESDLQAALFQDAFDDLSKEVLGKIFPE